MREMINMVIVLTVLSSFSGGLLAAIRGGTIETIESQQLKFDKAPAIKAILEGVINDPMNDRFKLQEGENEYTFFLGKYDDGRQVIVFETYGSGFGGDLGLMVGVDLAESTISGIGVTTHSETPGVGSKAKTDASYGEQYEGLTLGGNCKIKADGGPIDALSGATITSRGVSIGVEKAGALYTELKPQIVEKVKAMAGE